MPKNTPKCNRQIVNRSGTKKSWVSNAPLPKPIENQEYMVKRYASSIVSSWVYNKQDVEDMPVQIQRCTTAQANKSPERRKKRTSRRVKSCRSSLHPFLTTIVGALIRRLPLAICRVIAREARSVRGYRGLESQGTRQHVGVAAKTPLGVKAGRRREQSVLDKAAGECRNWGFHIIATAIRVAVRWRRRTSKRIRGTSRTSA